MKNMNMAKYIQVISFLICAQDPSYQEVILPV